MVWRSIGWSHVTRRSFDRAVCRGSSLKTMRRLLQFSTIALIVTLTAAPISEALDRWDPPGLGHDTEFALVALVICLALVVLVSRMLAMLGQAISLVAALMVPVFDETPRPAWTHARGMLAFAAFSPPLRI